MSKNAKICTANIKTLSSNFMFFELSDHCEILHSSEYAYKEKIFIVCIKVHTILVKKIWNVFQKWKCKILKKFKVEFWENGLSQANKIFHAGTYWG